MDALNKLRELEPISFLDGTMNITRVHNTGVAFGLGNGTVWSSYLFLAVPVLAIVVLVVLYRKTSSTRHGSSWPMSCCWRA